MINSASLTVCKIALQKSYQNFVLSQCICQPVPNQVDEWYLGYLDPKPHLFGHAFCNNWLFPLKPPKSDMTFGGTKLLESNDIERMQIWPPCDRTIYTPFSMGKLVNGEKKVSCRMISTFVSQYLFQSEITKTQLI